MESQEKSPTGKSVFVLPAHLIKQDQVIDSAVLSKLNANQASALTAVPAIAANTQAQSKPELTLVANSKPRNVFVLDKAKPLDAGAFPNQPRVPGSQILPTIANFQYMLAAYDIAVNYNVIAKKLEIEIAGHTGSFDNRDNVLLSQITSIAALNSFPTSQTASLLVALHYTRSGKGRKRYYLRPEPQGPEKQPVRNARAHDDIHHHPSFGYGSIPLFSKEG